jgi:precorrin-6B methylase 1
MNASVRLFACEELTLQDEEVYEVTASELREAAFPSRTVLLVIQRGELT